jgi:hypothetical protein
MDPTRTSGANGISVNQKERRILFEPKLCLCGCGKTVLPPAKFKPGHYSKVVWAFAKARLEAEER